MKIKPFPQFYWHVHHEELYEIVDKSIYRNGIKGRIEYIKNNKSPDEVETRLRLIKPVKFDKNLKQYKILLKAWKASEKARIAHKQYHKSDSTSYTGDYETTHNKLHDTELILKTKYHNLLNSDSTVTMFNKLHKQQCKRCPWNGSTIFPIKET